MKKKKNVKVRRVYDVPNDDGVIRVEALSEEEIEEELDSIDGIIDIETEVRPVDEDQKN